MHVAHWRSEDGNTECTSLANDGRSTFGFTQMDEAIRPRDASESLVARQLADELDRRLEGRRQFFEMRPQRSVSNHREMRPMSGGLPYGEVDPFRGDESSAVDPSGQRAGGPAACAFERRGQSEGRKFHSRGPAHLVPLARCQRAEERGAEVFRAEAEARVGGQESPGDVVANG